MNFIGLNSGSTIPLKPKVDVSKVQLEDIAIALARTPKFHGQLDRWYSWAEHCIHAQALLPPEKLDERLSALHKEDAAIFGLDRKYTKDFGYYRKYEDDGKLDAHEFATMHPARAHAPAEKLDIVIRNYEVAEARVVWLETHFRIIDTRQFLKSGDLLPVFQTPRTFAEVRLFFHSVEPWALEQKLREQQLECRP